MATDWLDASADLDERVDAVLADLTPEERTVIALGDFDPLTTRGLPAPDYVDAGTGLRDVPGATAFPAGIALAASFDPDLAGEYGAAVGAEARRAGFTVLLGPTLDLARDPRAGRIPEALGEDPYLSGLIGAAHVRGAQSNHLICQVKHFIAYNGEDRRTGYGLGPDRGDSMNVRISTGVLQDSYLRPFRAVVEAGAWSMMGSYNRVNGHYACESPDLLAIPRREWGWLGFYCPDFLFAVRDDASALAAGLDLGALGGPGGRTREMVEAARDGVVDTLVKNLVRALIGSGLADHPRSGTTAPSTVEHRELAERTAIAGAVLLRNERHALPLGPEVSSVAVIGPSGTDAIYVVGGSAAVDVDLDRLVTPADGILDRAGERDVVLAQGSLGDAVLPPVPATAFGLPDGSGPGVEVEFADASGRRWSGVLASIDHAVVPGEAASGWPARWRTRLTSEVTGPHRISLSLGGRATLRVDGITVLVGSREAEWFIHGPHYPLQATIHLTAGEPVELEIDYQEGPAIAIPPMGIAPVLRLGWQPPDDLIEQAVAAAQRCDAAVVIADQASGEGMDRDGLALPGDQDELIRRVAAANPRTIVVLNTPGAVLLPWLDQVEAVLQVWYPGERFGSALAAILFGDAEPGGRLPLTFPHDRAHLPGGDHGPDSVPNGLDYDADGGIGYRAPGIREHGAVFGFGHGLSYTDSHVESITTYVAGGELLIQISVSNRGDRDTVHVAQLYSQISGESPELVGVIRVPVQAGTSAAGRASVTADAFARWTPQRSRRLPVDGDHVLWVGQSSDRLGEALAVRVRHDVIVAVTGEASDETASPRGHVPPGAVGSG